jgi:CubicO group peptidase (beta-lactamase class C family)
MVTRDAAALDGWFERYLGAGFSGLIAIADGADVVAWRAAGDAHRGESIPNGLDTRFQVASGVKAFTGVAICQLVESGRLAGLDTRLRDCVDPALLGRLDERITIHHLLTHTSGITSYFKEDVEPDFSVLWRDRPVYRMCGPRDFLPMFVDEPMKFEPGARFEYCDGGYVLLGLVVEELTGRPFADHARDSVLIPAGMVDSGYFPADRLPARTARAYLDDEDGGWRTNVFAVPIVGGGDGGGYATAQDLVRFWQALASGRLLGSELTALLVRPHTATGKPDPHGHYGLGVWLSGAGPSGGHRYWFVEGSDPGVTMISGYFPDSATTVTLLANIDTPLWRAFQELIHLEHAKT